MLHGRQVPDKTILQKVSQRLTWAGIGSQAKIAVAVRKGYVIFSGTLQYEFQRRSVLGVASGVEGVPSVVDQLQVKPRERNWC